MHITKSKYIKFPKILKIKLLYILEIKSLSLYHMYFKEIMENFSCGENAEVTDLSSFNF